ncbi:MAG: aminoacyl-tRNA deacylase [Anaerovoracaceae bacterium]
MLPRCRQTGGFTENRNEEKRRKDQCYAAAGQQGIEYRTHDYTTSGAVAGDEVAASLGEDPDAVFKTLVTSGRSGEYYVFMVPVSGELNLKKAAKSVGEKNVEMIKSRELLPLTGYVHGGCSPIGMKKTFRTIIDISAADHQRIFFSGGRIGCQIETTLDGLAGIIEFSLADIAQR